MSPINEGTLEGMDAILEHSALVTIPEDEDASAVLPQSPGATTGLKASWLNDSRSVAADSIADTTKGVIDEQPQGKGVSPGSVPVLFYDRPAGPEPKAPSCLPKMSWKMWLLLAVLAIGSGGGIYGIISAVNNSRVPSTQPPSAAPSLSPSLIYNDDFLPTDEPTASPTRRPSLRPSVSIQPSAPPSPPVDIQELQHFLVENGLDSILLPSTPQSQAYQWLAYHDPAQIRISTDGEWRVMQRYLLGLFYFSLGGEDWLTKKFLTEQHECEWAGIKCSEEWVGVVTGIQLEAANLVGSLPWEMSKLETLQVMSFANNSLNGSIPETWWDFEKLSVLDLCQNQITGQLTSRVWDLPALEYFLVTDNLLKGRLPEVTNFRVLPLKYFDAGSNQLEGKVPASLWNLANLTRLYLEGNQLTGEFPPLPEAKNLSLQILKLHNNRLQGALPSTAQMDQLETVMLHDNSFSSAIPDSWFRNPKLKFLDLSENSFSGTIPDLADSPLLTDLYLNNNSLSGNLPEHLPVSIKYAWFHYNGFTGAVPQDFGVGSDNLISLFIHGNQLSGEISLCGTKTESNQTRLGADCSDSTPFLVECDCCECYPK